MIFAISAAIILINHYTGGLAAANSEILLWSSILTVFAMILGVISMLQHHWLLMARRRKNWPYSIVVLGSFLSTVALAYTYTPGYDFIINRLLASLQMALLAYVGFYTYTLFFRASGTKSPLVLTLLVFAIIGLFYNLPMRDAVWSGIEPIGTWVKDVPNTGASNALLIGVALGTILLFVRTILGYEESYLGG